MKRSFTTKHMIAAYECLYQELIDDSLIASPRIEIGS